MKKIILIFVCIISINICTLAKYIQNNYIKSETKILQPIIEIENDPKIEIKNIEQSKIEYRFSIKNYNEKEINKCDLLYGIEIINTFNNNEIDYILWNENDNKQVKLLDNKTEYIKLSKEKSEIKFKLILNLNDEKIVNGKIKVKIKVEQEKI